MLRRSNLPEDMEMDILLRLPVKSLLRFRCVSKSWCAHFQNPLFITNHYLKQTSLLNTNNNYANVSVLVDRVESKSYHEPSLPYFSLLEDQRPSIKENIYVPLSAGLYPMDNRVMGPCNGLMCLWYNDHITLWNPATREFKQLPQSHIQRPPNTVGTVFRESGFGFDSKTDNYKVIGIFDSYTDDNIIRQVDLYTLSTDSWRQIRQVELCTLSTWRQIWQLEFKDTSTNSWRDQPPELLVDHNQPRFDTYINGVFHWKSCSAALECIIAFDMADELFSTLSLPSNFSSRDNGCWYLGLLNGSLAIINDSIMGMGESFAIWVMKEYGVIESWTKQFTIGPIFGPYCPLGFWKNGRLFLHSHSVEDHQLVLYDPNTQQIEKFEIYSYGMVLTTRVVIYVESLVPINGRQEHEDERFIRLPTQMGDVWDRFLNNL